MTTQFAGSCSPSPLYTFELRRSCPLTNAGTLSC
jgi:hypothetical protein